MKQKQIGGEVNKAATWSRTGEQECEIQESGGFRARKRERESGEGDGVLHPHGARGQKRGSARRLVRCSESCARIVQ